MRVHRCVLCLSLTCVDRAQAAGDNGEAAIARFIDDVEQGGVGKQHYIFEVGANNGQWGNDVMTRLGARRSKRVRLVMFEPQQVFRKELQKLADKWDGLFFPMAAWTKATNLTF